MVETENSREGGTLGTWIFVLALSALLVGWGLLNYALIKDRPRAGDYGQLPDAPGESAYSTARPPVPQVVPPQIPRLPEAPPLPASRPEGSP